MAQLYQRGCCGIISPWDKSIQPLTEEEGIMDTVLVLIPVLFVAVFTGIAALILWFPYDRPAK